MELFGQLNLPHIVLGEVDALFPAGEEEGGLYSPASPRYYWSRVLPAGGAELVGGRTARSSMTRRSAAQPRRR